MKIFEQCKQCKKRAFCHWGEYEYWKIAHDNDCPHFKQNEQTNFYQLTKSPEALAEFLAGMAFDAVCVECPANTGKCDVKTCQDTWLEWLNKEEEK